MGYYDKKDARSLSLQAWQPVDNLDFTGCYGATEAFEQAIVDDRGEVVGKVQKGFTTFPPQHLGSFGLKYVVRRIADVDKIVEKRTAKRIADRAKAQAAKSYRSVITLTFDREWNLTGKTMEDRTVYTNTKGQHIKTRSDGSPRVHEIEGKFVVVYYPHPWKNGRGDINYRLKAAQEIPDECPVLDNI